MATRPNLPLRQWILGMLLWPALFCLPASTQAQGAWKRFWSQPPALRAWALAHPFAVGRAQALAQESIQVADSVGTRLDNDFIGGWADAFRHTFWMARTTQALGRRRAYSLGRAHERGNYQTFKRTGTEDGAVQDHAATRMDLLNNDVGIELGQRLPAATRAEMQDSVLCLVYAGELYRIKKDAYRNSLDADDRFIPEQEWLGKWKNARVVVKGSAWPQGLLIKP